MCRSHSIGWLRGFLFLVAVMSAALAQDAEALYREGTRLFAERNAAAAIRALERSVEARPNYAEAWKALGVVHAAQGDYEAAAEPFRKACRLRPELADACLYYGRVLYLLNQFQPAVDVLRSALQTDKRNSPAYRILGLSLEALGETGEAASAFQEAVALYRGSAPNEDPGIDYGVFLFRQGRAEEALPPLAAAAGRHPDASRAQLEWGGVLLALDRLPEAERHLERAVALDPASARAHLLLGKTYMRLGKKDAAAEQLRQGSRTVK